MTPSVDAEKSNARQFLEAFTEIEGQLRRQTLLPPNINMARVLREAAEVNATVKQFEFELEQYSFLRNALSHDRIRGEPIAEPHDDVVRKVECIRELLLHPPMVGQLFSCPVDTFAVSDPVLAFARDAWSHNHSQAPVYSGSRFRGLLVADTVTRWLGASTGSQSVEEVTIGEILECSESTDNYHFVAAQTSVAAVAELFEKALQEGKRLDAVLVTGDGTENGELLGIVTAWDLPKAYRCLRGSCST